MKFRLFGSLLFRFLLTVALLLPIRMLVGQTEAPSSATAESEAAKRMEWLKSRFGPAAVPQPTPTVVKKHFADTHTPGLRPLEVLPGETGTEKKPPLENDTAGPHSVPLHTADTHSTEPHPKKAPRADRINAESPTVTLHTLETPTPNLPPKKAPRPERSNVETPSVAARTPETPAPNLHSKIAHPAASPTPAAVAIAPHAVDKPASTPRRSESLAIDTHTTDIHFPEGHTPTPPPLKSLPTTTHTAMVTNRYPWKVAIVTTVFWIGEPTGGNNFTPNYSSSWDANWSRTYGGFDNPDPEARRNFIPVKFTPRQNPFYVALPYNDVTRGTTKPEARVVIPWFKEVFRKDGQSVCRDRWIAIRNRAGRVGYAQWSDCGPFRTDHWQYVFGMERPKPNLNQGAGLDVSPALRDYLGLQSTDVTDWKFVDARDVPNGPWSLYGENNTFTQKGVRLTKAL